MKVPPKRKGNLALIARVVVDFTALNERPSEKEGKSALAREGMLGESDPQ